MVMNRRTLRVHLPFLLGGFIFCVFSTPMSAVCEMGPVVQSADSVEAQTVGSSGSLVREMHGTRWLRLGEKASFFGQNTLESRTGNLVTQNRMRATVLGLQRDPTDTSGELLDLYIGAHIEEDTKSKRDLIYNDNFMAPVLGVSTLLPQWGVGAYAEAQYQFREADRLNMRERDEARGVLEGRFALFHSYFHEFGARSLAHGFVESYTEGVQRTELGPNLFFAHTSRVGPRWPWGRWALDVFPEMNFKRDRQGLPWENITDIRAGARVGYRADSWSISLHATRATGFYAGDREFRSQAKGLLTIGIEI